MAMKNNIRNSYLLIILFGIIVSCSRDEVITDPSARLLFSADTVTFDTVFTQVATVTKAFKIYNTNDKSIKISKAYLEKAEDSNFRISIDGANAVEYSNIEIPPHDSVFVFVEATLDPVGGNLPLVVEDAIVFSSNGNTEAVILEAFGQNVHLLSNETVETTSWEMDKPYLIYGNLTVEKDHTLTIKEGVQVYLHHNSSVAVLGKLLVEGTLDEPVVFTGDRLDMGYDLSAGRWGAVYFDPQSKGNKLEYATIKNASAGIQAGYPNEDGEAPQIELVNTQILNSSFAGILAYGAEITAYNTLVADSKFFGFAAFMGGKYNFYHSTISVNGAFTLQAGRFEVYERSGDGLAVALLNYYFPYYTYDDNYIEVKKVVNNDLLEANFYNSIIYGNQSNEFDTVDNNKAAFNFHLSHCIVKSDSMEIQSPDNLDNVLINKYPFFINDSTTMGVLDFALDTLSPAKDFGDPSVVKVHSQLQYDYFGVDRLADGKPDLGPFERVE